MTQTRWRLPDTPIGRVRLGTLAFGVVTTLAQLLQLAGGVDASYRAIAVLGMVIVVGTMLITARIKRLVSNWDGPSLAVATLMIGVGLEDPKSVVAVAMAVVTAQSMYGAWPSALARVACLVPIVPLSVALSPSTQVPWYSGQVISLTAPVVLFGVLMRSLKTALEGQAAANARQHYLSRLSNRLLGATDYPQIHAVMGKSTMDLVGQTPGLIVISMLVRAPGPEQPYGVARVVTVHGAPAPAVKDLPYDLFARLDRQDLNTFPVFEGGTAALMERGLPRRHWFGYASDLATPGELGINLVLYGVPVSFAARFLHVPVHLPDDLQEVIRGSADQVRMAQYTSHMYMELTQRSHHDELTDMPNRAVLFRELGYAIAASGGTASVAVMIVDLDDFKDVNALGGHAAGDALLTEAGRRITDELGDDGLAVRYGGDEFAVLLPYVSGLDEAHEIAERVAQRLAEPLQLAGTPVRPMASIGLAVTGDDVDGEDLVRCADIAMHAAKTSGKGRINVFALDTHGAAARLPQ